MSKLFNWAAARIVAAFALALPLAAMAATPVAVWDGDFSDLTKFTGYELLDWNQTHGENNSSVTIDRANQGLMFRSSTGKAGVTVLVRYSNLQAGTNNRVLFATTVNSDYTGTRTGIRMNSSGELRGIWGNTEWNDNRNSNYGSVPASGVMAFTYSKAGTYLYSGSNADRLAETWKCTSLMASADTDSSQIRGVSIGGYNEGASANGYEAALDMTIDAIAVFDSVITLDEMQEYTWPSEEPSVCAVSRTVASDATVNWADATWTVGENADQTFTPSADTLYTVTVTVGGNCTIVMPESIGAFNRRRIKFVLDDGVGSATVALKYSGTLPGTGSSVTLNPFGDALIVVGSGVTLSPAYNGDTAGYIVSVSDLTVTIVKGSNYEGTLTADTNWSDIKPEGWANAIAGNEPSIVVNYEGEDPITLTFDEAVAAGSLTITGNIVVEASAAATFGTITAGSGSVVEMANVAVTTQTGAGIYRYRSNYPSTVPNNSLTYEYIGGVDSASAGNVVLNAMRGTVKTFGFMNITGYYPLLTNARLDVVSGTTTLSAGSQGICGYLTIREGATLVNTTTDSLAYSDVNSVIDIYGTLDMGTSRWTTWSGAAINLRGGEITGVGEGNNGAIDLMGIGNVHAYADSTISANVKFRNDLSNVTVDNGVTLTISGVTKPGYNSGGITKKGNGTLKFTSDPYVPAGITVEDGTLAFDTQSDVDPVVTYTASVLKDANMDYVSASNWKGTVIVSAVAAGDTATQIALNKTGNANSYLTLNAISGNAWCAGSDYTVQPEITLAGDVNFQNGSSKKTVTFRKIAAGTGNLSLKSWANCTGITYGFTTLDADNYTGTIQLDGSVLTFNVGDILKAGAAVGDKVLPLTVTNSAAVNFNNATLNGKAAGFELREDGVYYTTAYVAVNVPKVANTTVAVSVGGNPVSPATEGESTNTYSVAEGATVTVTYSSADYEVIGGTFEFTASEGYTVDITGVTTAPYVAQIKVGTEYEKYTSVAQALTSENVYRGITLLGNATEGTLDITQQYVMLTGAGYTLTADITVGASTTFVPYNVTLDGDITVNGIYNQMGTVAVTGDLTTGDGARLQFSTLGTDVAALTVGGDIAVNGALTLTPNSTSGLTTGVAYKTLNGATVTLAEGASVTLGTIEGAILGYVVEPNETTTLTIKIPAAKVGEDDYHDTFASARAAAAGVGVITLLKDVSSVVTNYNTQTGYITSIVTNDLVTIAADEVLKINANGYVICVGLASGLTPPVYTLSTVTDGNVATYSVVHSVASVDNELYPSLAAAVAAAEAGDTITLLADDHVSFSLDNLEIAINKALTIDGAGYTVYGVNDYAGGSGDHDFYISGSGDIAIKNVTLANFAGGVGNNMRTYPIWTGSAYAGTLTLDNVTVQNFNRTAFNLNGGTVVVTNCTITGDTTKDSYFQEGIGVYNANVTIVDTAISNVGSNLEKEDSKVAACIQLGNPNGPAVGTGSITVVNGTYSGEYGIIVASNAQNTVSVQGGTFVGGLMVEEGEGGNIAVSGGTFDAVVPEEYLAEGYEVLDNGDGTYGVREDKGWIYAAPGYWNYTGTWSEGATLGEEKVTIEDGATYTASEASDGRFVTVAMTLSFDDANDDDDDFGDAKAAIRLASGETDGTYQFQLYTSDGANNVWTNATVVGVTATKEVDYNFVIVLDLTNKIYTASVVTDAGATTNALTIGENVTEIPFACQGEITPVQQIDFVGAGKVSSIEGSYETPEEPPAPEGFDEDDTIGEVKLTAEQATWLNEQNNYDELATKIATMTADAFNNAYLLNLDITGEFSYEFTVTNIEVGDDDVTLTVSLTRTGTLDETTKINGTVALTGTDELGKEFETISEATVADEDFSEGSTTTITLDKGDAKFFQPVIK